MEELAPNLTSVIAQAINWIILFVIVVGIATLVFKDAAKRGISTRYAVLWALASVFTFPIGLLLYVFIGKDLNVKGHTPSP